MTRPRQHVLLAVCTAAAVVFVLLWLISLAAPITFYHVGSPSGMTKVWSESGGLQICRIDGPQQVLSVIPTDAGIEPATIGIDLSDPGGRWVHFNVRHQTLVYAPPRYDSNVRYRQVSIGWLIGVVLVGVPAAAMWMRRQRQPRDEAVE